MFRQRHRGRTLPAHPVLGAGGLALLLLLMTTAPAWAGTIFGNLRFNGNPLPAGTRVGVVCGGNQHGAETDQYGSYNLNLPPGRCQLAVNFNGTWSLPYPVTSSDDPARYDFDLVYENNQLVLKRR
jgi:hypothetical protein